MKHTRESLARLIQEMGIGDQSLLDAFLRVSRADFVPADAKYAAYEDRPLPIPHDQVTTQPSLTAQMIAALKPGPTNKVLEIGTGYGFQTALLGVLCRRVISVERFRDLAEQAQRNLASAGVDNVVVRVGDGSLGARDEAPFDAVLVSAAYPEVPEPLVEQLIDGGRLVQPIGTGGSEMVTLYVKNRLRLDRIAAIVPARFVPLIPDEAPLDQS